MKRTSSCTDKGQALLTSAMCSNTDLVGSNARLRFGPPGEYSLTNCFAPNNPNCELAGTSPEWMLVAVESQFGDTNSSGTCRTNYKRVACTIPTCTSERRLNGTLTFNQCKAAYDCAKAAERKIEKY
jgi:hypothetical protein